MRIRRKDQCADPGIAFCAALFNYYAASQVLLVENLSAKVADMLHAKGEISAIKVEWYWDAEPVSGLRVRHAR